MKTTGRVHLRVACIEGVSEQIIDLLVTWVEIRDASILQWVRRKH